ncbi:helix-turn-helix domain-containing protein [Ornithinicoccus halotolerans]|uniref:helix-turn-helix domain-containing protein n=1 Tax=Ornithinicoccus halotolerans TaxID=1748220 RepID=UPI001296F007
MVARAPRSTHSRPRWESINDAADRLGVHHQTVRRWVSAGRLEAVRFGPRVLRVRVEDVDRLGTPLPTAGGGPLVG